MELFKADMEASRAGASVGKAEGILAKAWIITAIALLFFLVMIGVLILALSRQQRRGRAHLRGTHGWRRNLHEDGRDLLRASLRPVPRQVRRELDDHSREGDAAERVTVELDPD